ncbi:MAG: DUF2490 domain-containing protein [Bacteroidales bacterium]|jgi:hypothetical protein|nr:DUF2490 domain-containing protein [Bacteroidales bacterium]
MKKLLITLALLLPLAAAAQSTTEGSVRASAGVDVKIRKGLHLSVEEEIRMNGAFKNLNRLQTTVKVEYKPLNWMKLGLGYSLINPYSYANMGFKNTRHRVFFDVGAHYTTFSRFSFSIRERIQLTHRSGVFNAYQNTPNKVELKSRVGVEYKGWTYFEPGVFFELRTALNDPWGEVSGEMKYKDDGTTYYDYTPLGYTHVYNSRYRAIFRTDIKLSKHHVLEPYAYVDYLTAYKIDTNSEGTRLFRAEYDDHFRISLGISYTFKF